LVRPKDLIKGHPTLSRLLTQVPGAERLTAGRAKTQLALQTVCPSGSASSRPSPALSLDGVEGQKLKVKGI